MRPPLLMQSTEETWHRALAAGLLPGLKGVSARRWPWWNTRTDAFTTHQPVHPPLFTWTRFFSPFFPVKPNVYLWSALPLPEPSERLSSELFGMSHDVISSVEIEEPWLTRDSCLIPAFVCNNTTETWMSSQAQRKAVSLRPRSQMISCFFSVSHRSKPPERDYRETWCCKILMTLVKMAWHTITFILE